MDVDPVLEALLTPEGRDLVERLTPFDEGSALRRLEAVRREPEWRGRPEVVAAAATQARLRTRAMQRFPGPPRWWTADGLEQATRPEVSRLHAQRFARAGIPEVADLGCGAGSDALAFAEEGLTVTAVDGDPEALWAARASAHDRGLAVSTVLGDVTADHWWWNEAQGGAARGPAALATAARGCFVDPARRRAGRRLLDPERWSPSWSWVCALAERVPATGAKIAPGISHDKLPPGTESEWISVDGDLVECGTWWGPLRAGTATRVAAVRRPPTTRTTPAGHDPTGQDVGVAFAEDRIWSRQARPAQGRLVEWARLDDSAGIPEPTVGPVAEWLVEPDPAVIRSGLVSVLAERIGGHLLDRHIAYVLTEHAPDPGPFGTVWQVIEELPFARKLMRRHLRDAGFGDVVVKKRGVAVVPEELRASLHLRGTGPTAVLVLTRTASGPLALRVERGPGR